MAIGNRNARLLRLCLPDQTVGAVVHWPRLALGWPRLVLVIDHENMAMVSVVPGMGAQMRVVWRKIGMRMGQRPTIFGRPDQQAHPGPGQRQRAKDQHRHRQAKGAAGPAGHRICHQPASMRQRELRRKNRRSVLGVGRMAQQAARGA